MQLTFNTLVVDISAALNAIKLYQAGEFQKAIDSIQCVLDLEPNNWDARLMLAACYYKTGQFASAHRAFQLICDRTTCEEVRAKAKEGAEVTAAKITGNHIRPAIPAEFGCHIELLGMKQAPKQMSWL